MGAVRINGLGKRYKRYASDWSRIAEWSTGGRLELHEPNWVLRDIHFEVRPGEATAVVGRNGAGKSTLLRLINGTLRASEGSVEAEGRIAALELGLRFHDDLSGVDNAMLSGQLLGMSSSQIREHMPGIEAFSELGAKLLEPVRTYSAGMRLRLAFSVVTAIRPDILLVDEALAVGDIRFQQKCLARIRGFLDDGTCLVLVSHDLNAIRSVCDSAVLLEQGRLLRRGDPVAVLDYYNALLAGLDGEAIEQTSDDETGYGQTRSGAGQATIEAVELRDGNGPGQAFPVGARVRVVVKGRTIEAIADLTVGIAIRDRLGKDAFGTNSHFLRVESSPERDGEPEAASKAGGMPRFAAGERFEAEFELPLNLGQGDYTLTVALHAGRTHVEGSYDWWDRAVAFQVLPGEEPHFEGTAYLPTQLRVRRQPAESQSEVDTRGPSTEVDP